MGLSLSPKIALDLGSSKAVTALVSGSVRYPFCEPTLLGIDVSRGRVEHFGAEAWDRMGKTPNGLQWVYPVRRGAIADYAAVLYFLKKAFSKSLPSPRMFKPSVLASVPINLTSVAVRALGDAVHEAGGGSLCLIPCTIASAIQLTENNETPTLFIVDFGDGVTDISIVAFNEIVVGKTIPIGGEDIDNTLQRLLEFSYGLKVGRREAEEIKKTIGIEDHAPEETISRRKAEMSASGLVSDIRIPMDAVAAGIRKTLQPLFDGIVAVLEESPPELFEEIFKTGIILVGGSSRMPGLKNLIEEKTRMRVWIPQKPELVPIQGAAKMLRDRNFAKKYAGQLTVVS